MGEEDDFVANLTRVDFEAIIKPVFKKMLKPLDKVLKISGFSKEEIDEIVMVGGTSRIPIIRQKISDYFDGK